MAVRRPTLSPGFLARAVNAYDAERRRLNALWQGSKEPPMSDENKRSIAPMIEAAIIEYLRCSHGEMIGAAKSD